MPTETTAPRLIDANALIAKLEENQENYEQYREIVKGLQKAIDAIHSAPTVETTDDVLARIPKNCRYTFEQRVDTFIVWTRDWRKDKDTVFGH